MATEEEQLRNVTRADIESRLGADDAKGRRSEGTEHGARIARQNLANTVAGSNRATRMLGGNLGGVQRKRGIQAGRLGYWIIGGLILLVGIALLIPEPQPPANVTTAVEGVLPQTPEPDEIYRESRLDEGAGLGDQGSSNFVREDDLARAQVYAEQDRIDNLIAESIALALELEAAGHYGLPVGESAADMYLNTLKLNPQHSEALQGINRALDQLLSSARSALQRNTPDRANALLARMREIDSDNNRIAALEASIAQFQRESRERQENIAELLRAAEVAITNGSILSPPRDNAVFYFQQVLALEPANTMAAQGVDRIIRQQLETASTAILGNDLQTATSLLNTVETLDPGHEGLTLLRAQIIALSAEPEAETGGRQQWRLQTEPEQESTAQAPENDQTSDQAPASPGPAPVSKSEVQPEQGGQLAVSENDIDAGVEHYYHGRYAEALAILKPLADRGVARAQFRYAVMQQYGRGTTTNRNEAEDLFRRALPAIRTNAEAGEPWAQADLASLYEDGMVVAQDLEQAVSWYQKAAEQGYAGAQTNLGILYYYGRGVEQDREIATEWFRAAADQGDRVARENLDKLGIR